MEKNLGGKRIFDAMENFTERRTLRKTMFLFIIMRSTCFLIGCIFLPLTLSITRKCSTN